MNKQIRKALEARGEYHADIRYTIPVSLVRDIYQPGEGRHWFDRSTMRFFSSKLPAYAYVGPGGVFFVTSEQPPHGARKYSVRELVAPGKINTIGGFCQYSVDEARAIAKDRAAGIDAPA